MWIAVTQGVAAVAKEALAPRGEGGGGGGWGDSAPDAPVEQGNKEGYTFDWDLGTQERLGDAMLVMHQFEQTPAAVFPFSLGQCGEIIYNEKCDLQNPPFFRNAWVQVTDVMGYHFTFTTLPGHFDPPGSTISFSVYNKGEDVYLRQTATWNIHNWAQRLKAWSTEGPAWLTWQEQADNLREQAGAYQFMRTGDVDDFFAYFDYTRKGYTVQED
jgi:hypothetical protein